MKKITFEVSEPYRAFLLNGKKTIEGRLRKGKYINIEIGDIFELLPAAEFFQVINVKYYRNFRDLIIDNGVENVIPNMNTVDDAVNVYYEYYSPEDEEKYGVVGIKLERQIT